MPTQHSLVPVGMMGVQTNPTNLQSDLQKIYEGDTTFQPPLPEACNAVHAYQEENQTTQTDPLEKAKQQYTDLVQKASLASSGRSTCLVGDFTQKDPLVHWFYDLTGQPPPNALAPNLTRMGDWLLAPMGCPTYCSDGG